jgi:hypothetical protein
MKILVQIQANTYINYSKEEQAPIWCLRGTQMFNIYIPYDSLINDEQTCIEAFNLMLFEESSDNLRYEYVDYTIMWVEPKQLHDSTFLEKFKNVTLTLNVE